VTTTTPVTHWETTLFSSGPVAPDQPAGRGWDAPFFDGIDDQLSDARTRLERVSARAAYQEVLYGRALLVDIRPAAQRAREGEVAAHLSPLVVERNVLEWRFDPRSEARLERASYHARVIVLCQEGYTSSLAADALVRLGVRRATDLVGGFRAWREAGLPVAPRAVSPSAPA
jgi:rhodanese-related sulfurtransferase